ncbi:MAG: cyclopropane-fatty-acyl-phospholipid synthase, partial [Thermodesulfobacteriota bacterium]|nr:cyclopropane-fatty-acyl-phospholipid synthase [Thermodesulfobacteriota bacterium]
MGVFISCEKQFVPYETLNYHIFRILSVSHGIRTGVNEMDKKKYRRVVEGMLSEIGVSINGPEPWDICVRDERMFGRVLSDKSLGLGESYMEGWWDCPRIDELIYRILCADLGSKIRGNLSLLVPVVQAWASNRQSKVRAHDVA